MLSEEKIMKIAVINEVSAKEKNPEIVEAILKSGNEVINVGMAAGINNVELTYIHTGLMAGIVLNLGVVDMVVGGCGTGQGFMLSAMQYPKVFCGLILEPLDAWLFSQINGGNCISLALNKGYGWAGKINLEYVFEKLFKDESGAGYPPERKESQQISRDRLHKISELSHKTIEEILDTIDIEILKTIFAHKPFVDAIRGKATNKNLQNYIIKKYLEENK